MLKELICIVCPNGCELTSEVENGVVLNVRGALCKRGIDYVQGEVTNPVRTISTVIRVLGGEMPLASVRLDRPIPKKYIFAVMEQIKALQLPAPVKIGQVVLENVHGCNIIVTQHVDSK